MALKLLNPSLRPLGQFDLHLTAGQEVVGGECVKLAALASDAAWDSKNVGPFSGTTQVNFQLGTFERGSLCGLADEGSAGYGTSFGTQIGQNAGYGTQVPLNTGAALAGGAVVIGPSTEKGSGKVTVWHAPGLYAVDAAPLSETATTVDYIHATATTTIDEQAVVLSVIDATTVVNAAIFADGDGKLLAAANADFANRSLIGGHTAADERTEQLGIFVGNLKDSSLVSTPLTLASTETSPGASTATTDNERAYGSAYASQAEEYVIYFLGNQGLV